MNFMTPIESPNLPKRGITLAAVSVGAEKAKEYLLSRGISVFDILPTAQLPTPICICCISAGEKSY